MRNKKFKRLGAALLAAALIMPGLSGMGTVSAAEDTAQMASDKEVVYVNEYSDTAKREQNFDSNWKFYLGDAAGAEGTAFDDSRWDTVSLPHDYSIEQEYSKSMEAESGYLPGGTGWYRKHFILGSEMEGKQLRIDFGGVYMNATVWVNGTQLGTHPFGYTPFSFDITDYVKIGEENVITVKVEHKTPSSRWYSGSGIYRSVNLTVTDEVYVDLYGTKIETPNLESEQGGTVSMNVKTNVVNKSAEAKDVVLVHTIYEKGTESSIGTVTTDSQSVAAGESAEISAVLPADNPKLWDTENPKLYTVVTEVKVGDEVTDTYETEYGFRYISFDTETGFYLNGENVKLKGVCMHHDQGSLGAEAHYRAIERQVEILQEMGCNSIRVTHNPAANELIEICNEKGILVIDELFDGWMYAKNGNYNDYSVWFRKTIEASNEILGSKPGMTWAEFDLKTTINRGKNDPSVIMFSLGNEIQEGAGGTGYNTMCRSLIQWAREVDTTKLLTIGSNAVKNGGSEHIDIANQLTAVGGVSGTNYSNGSSYDNLHAAYPNWYLYGSETASHINSRGVYDRISGGSQTYDKQLTSYDYSAVGWGAVASSAWYDVITRDFVAGEYVWTGFDYLGEPTPWNGTGSGAVGAWPSPKNSYFGIVDTAGFPKDNYYLYQSQWNEDVTTLHVLPAWNSDVVYKDYSGKVPVVVYSDAAAVELFFRAAGSDTQTSLGKKAFTEKTTAAGYTYQIYEGSDKDSTAHRNLYLTWKVPYEDGTITAVAYDKAGNVITETEGRSYVTTTGEEARLAASVDRDEITADGKDLAYVTVDVTDAEGNIVPDASNRVKITVEGDGVLVGVDNGKQADHDSFQADNREAYNGKMLAIVQSTKEAGSFTVTATADGLESDSVTVHTTASDTVSEISFYMSKNYYVKVGDKPVLPDTIELRTGGESKDVTVVWDEIKEADYNKAGTFTVNGTADGKYAVSVFVNMIEEVGGLLNYSTATAKGVAPILPDARPAALVDGTILDVSFPVVWDPVEAEAYAEPGTVVVNGVADVFGTEMKVTASVRVQEESLSIGDSVSGAAYLSQDIPEALQSDTLDAIKDGSTEIAANSDGGPNPTAWSNYANSQAGDNTAEIVFEYDTQQRIGEIVIHFWKDGYSAEFPDAGTTEIYISDDGQGWTKVDAEETIGTEVSRVKAYTYSFTPFTATFVKFCITNSTAQKAVKACTGITEIELKKVTGTFSTNTTAAIAGLTVNGVAATAGELASGVFYTSDRAARVKVVPEGNASVTVLPAYDDQIVIITESEDHKTRETFAVILGQEKPADPSDASNDYPVSKLTAISESQYLPGTANEGPDDYVLDGKASTHWHTNWNTTEAKDVAKRWIGLSLEEATEISGIRYLPRTSGGSNGAVTEYKVQYRETDDGEWIDLASGTWDRTDSDWKLVPFAKVTAKQIRVIGVHTYADSGYDAHMSTAELRVQVPGTSGNTTVDITELIGKLLEAEAIDRSKYTADSAAALEAAIEKADAVCENADRTEEEVAAAIAELEAAVKGLKTEQTNTFEDVQADDFFYDAVIWAAENRIVEGWTDTTFEPYRTCTRGQVVSFIWRAQGCPKAEQESGFADVAADAYYAKAVAWAVEEGITDGWTETTFEPEMTVTRGQAVTFLYRAAGMPEVSEETGFEDVAAGAYYAKAVAWAVEEGITDGWTETTFAPEEGCTRGQIVTFLYRAK
ncbi:MAG: sugar-binding domain-containing protein [Lachnospiraceae bacterium]